MVAGPLSRSKKRHNCAIPATKNRSPPLSPDQPATSILYTQNEHHGGRQIASGHAPTYNRHNQPRTLPCLVAQAQEAAEPAEVGGSRTSSCLRLTHHGQLARLGDVPFVMPRLIGANTMLS